MVEESKKRENESGEEKQDVSKRRNPSRIKVERESSEDMDNLKQSAMNSGRSSESSETRKKAPDGRYRVRNDRRQTPLALDTYRRSIVNPRSSF